MPDNKLWVGGQSGAANDLSNANNWSPAGVPVTGDFIWFEHSTVDATDGMNQSAVVPGSITMRQSYTGNFGTASAYVQWGTPARVDIGEHRGIQTALGSRRVKLDLSGGSSTGVVVVHNSHSISVDGNGKLPPIRLLLPAAGVDLHVKRGKVGVAVEPGETSTLGDLQMTYVNSRSSDADVTIGAGVTLTNVYKGGGELDLLCAATLVENTAGKLVTAGSGAIPTLRAHGGLVVPNSRGPITNLEAYGAFVDFLQSAEARTVTNFKIRGNGSFALDPGIVTVTNWLWQQTMKMAHSAA